MTSRNCQEHIRIQPDEYRTGKSIVAEELTGVDLDRRLQIYNGRFQDPATHGVGIMPPEEDVRAPSFYRLYRAIAQGYWVLDQPVTRTTRCLYVCNLPNSKGEFAWEQ